MGFDLSAKEYENVARANRSLAKKLKRVITPDTIVVIVDKGGRFVRVPLALALKEEGVVMPRSFFINPTNRKRVEYASPGQGKNFDFFKRGEEHPFDEEVGEWLKQTVRGVNFNDILIIDEYAETGETLRGLKKAFENVTGKKVRTAVLSSSQSSPVHRVDFVGSRKLSDPMSSAGGLLYRVSAESLSPVKSRKVGGSFIQKSERAKNLFYPSYVRNIKSAFERTRVRRR